MISCTIVLICLGHIRKTTLHRSFGSDLTALGFIGCVIWFRINFRPGCERKLSRNEDGFTGVNATLEHGHFAILSLTGLDSSPIELLVRLKDEAKRTIPKNSHCLAPSRTRRI